MPDERKVTSYVCGCCGATFYPVEKINDPHQYKLDLRVEAHHCKVCDDYTLHTNGACNLCTLREAHPEVNEEDEQC